MKILDWLFLPLNYKPEPKDGFGSIGVDDSGFFLKKRSNTEYTLGDDFSSITASYNYNFDFTCNWIEYSRILCYYNSWAYISFFPKNDPTNGITVVQKGTIIRENMKNIQATELPNGLKEIFIPSIITTYCITEKDNIISSTTATKISFPNVSEIDFSNLDGINYSEKVIWNGIEELSVTKDKFKLSSKEVDIINIDHSTTGTPIVTCWGTFKTNKAVIESGEISSSALKNISIDNVTINNVQQLIFSRVKNFSFTNQAAIIDGEESYIRIPTNENIKPWQSISINLRHSNTVGDTVSSMVINYTGVLRTWETDIIMISLANNGVGASSFVTISLSTDWDLSLIIPIKTSTSWTGTVQIW